MIKIMFGRGTLSEREHCVSSAPVPDMAMDCNALRLFIFIFSPVL